jgi:hypothetical protein
MMDELARLLSRECHLLELLLFKLVEGRHLLAAGEARFLPYAAAEVERAMERVQEVELRRSILVHDLARDLGVPEGALTMSALAEDSAEPYRTIFADHLRAFFDLGAEIDAVTRQNRLLTERGVHDTAQVMLRDDTLEGLMVLQIARYGYRAFLAATADLSMPSLVDLLH